MEQGETKMNTIRKDLVHKVKDLAREYDQEPSVLLSDFFNYEAQKQYKKAMKENCSYYGSDKFQEYSQHLFEVYSRAFKMKYNKEK